MARRIVRPSIAAVAEVGIAAGGVAAAQALDDSSDSRTSIPAPLAASCWRRAVARMPRRALMEPDTFVHVRSREEPCTRQPSAVQPPPCALGHRPCGAARRSSRTSSALARPERLVVPKL